MVVILKFVSLSTTNSLELVQVVARLASSVFRASYSSDDDIRINPFKWVVWRVVIKPVSNSTKGFLASDSSIKILLEFKLRSVLEQMLVVFTALFVQVWISVLRVRSEEISTKEWSELWIIAESQDFGLKIGPIKTSDSNFFHYTVKQQNS